MAKGTRMRLAAIIFGAAMLAAGGARADQAGFKDWWAVCDNVRECSAYGFVAEGSDAMGFVRIERGAAPDAGPRVSVGTLGETAKAWRAEIDGKPIPGLPPINLEATEEADIEVVTLDPAQSAAVIEGVRNGRTLVLLGDGKPGPVISLAGSSAALRWIDAEQKRAGTTSALVAKGAKAMISRPPERPLIRPAVAVDQSKLPKRPPASVLALRGECDPDMVLNEETWTPEVHRLSPGRLLWIVPCSRGAYNVIADLFTADERGGAARPELVPYGAERVGSLMNVTYDPDSRTLSNFDKARGIGDCGGQNQWTWTDRGFDLSRSLLMGECRGVISDLWPTTFVSRDR